MAIMWRLDIPATSALNPDDRPPHMIHADTHTDECEALAGAGRARNVATASREGGDRPDVDTRSLRVLIVEDEFFISLHTKGLLQALGHVAVAVAVSADQAVAIAERERPDVVLMDIRLLGSRDGIDAAEEIRHRLGIGSIFVTANTDRADPPARRGRESARIS